MIPPRTGAAARPAAGDAGKLTEECLVNGWGGGPHVRIRQARAGDLDALRPLVAMTGADLDDQVAEAVRVGFAGGALRAALRAGRDGFSRHMAERFFAYQKTDQTVPLLHAALVLVAEHEQHGVVGALVAHPPAGVVANVLRHAGEGGADPHRQFQLLVSGATGLVKITAIAVEESHRGQGVGGALLERCRQIYVHCGYFIIYGQAPPASNVDAFYRRRGFAVLEPAAGFDPWVVFGIHSHIYPDGDRTFFI